MVSRLWSVAILLCMIGLIGCQQEPSAPPLPANQADVDAIRNTLNGEAEEDAASDESETDDADE